MTLTAVLCSVLAIFSTVAYSLPSTQQYPLKLQPELDRVDIKSYLSNDRLVRFQLKCIVLDGPCDVVGKWAKPRAKAALLGECLLCTPYQKEAFENFATVMAEKYPDMYRAAIAKYLHNEGFKLDKVEEMKIETAFKEEEEQLDNPKTDVAFENVEDIVQILNSSPSVLDSETTTVQP